MSYDEGLGERIRDVMRDLHGVTERKMFGGLAFMIRGHMAVGIVKEDLMVRVGPEAYDSLVGKAHAHTRTMDSTGKPMKGFLCVDAEGLKDDHALAHWVGHGVEYALSLPPKAAPATRAPKKRAIRKRE